jgi:hypothetical protein
MLKAAVETTAERLITVPVGPTNYTPHFARMFSSSESPPAER